jgi:P-type E1-E2 ATPase
MGSWYRGESAVNQAPITGESVPVDKKPGDTVFAGTINGEGALEIKVTKTTGDTTLARIIRLVAEAQEQKAPTQRFVDVFARYYTPAVTVVALAGISAAAAVHGRRLEHLALSRLCAAHHRLPVRLGHFHAGQHRRRTDCACAARRAGQGRRAP